MPGQYAETLLILPAANGFFADPLTDIAATGEQSWATTGSVYKSATAGKYRWCFVYARDVDVYVTVGDDDGVVTPALPAAGKGWPIPLGKGMFFQLSYKHKPYVWVAAASGTAHGTFVFVP